MGVLSDELSGSGMKPPKWFVPFIVLLFPALIAVVLLRSCEQHVKLLPYYGQWELSSSGDTVYPVIPAFNFINQEGRPVSNKTYDGKIYVADFFFATCPSICPKMTRQMKRIQDKFKDNPDVMLLSHTVNPEKDTVEALAAYAKEHGVDPAKWHLVTGSKKEIYEIARHYLMIAAEDSSAADHNGFIHSPMLVLIDKEKHIRSICDDGTNFLKADTLMDEIAVLLQEYKDKIKQK